MNSRMRRLNRLTERFFGGGRKQEQVQPQAELLISQEDLAAAIVLVADAISDLEAAEELLKRDKGPNGTSAAATGEGGAPAAAAAAQTHDGHIDAKALVKYGSRDWQAASL